MESQHARLIQTLTRVHCFLEAKHGIVSAVVTPVARKNIVGVAGRMIEHAAAQRAQASVVRSTSAAKRALKRALIDQHIRPIVIVARMQGPAVCMRVSGALERCHGATYEAVIAEVGRLADLGRVHEQAFVEAGLPQDFVGRLVKATRELAMAGVAKNHAAALLAEATAGLSREARSARAVLRLLDALIRSSVKADDPLLGEWATARRIAAAPASAAVSVPA